MAILVLASFIANAKGKRVVINTLDQSISPANSELIQSMIAPKSMDQYQIEQFDQSKIIPSKVNENLLLGVEEIQRVSYNLLADTSDSSLIYPPNVNTQIDPWAFTGMYDYPFNMGQFGTTYGFGQFQPSFPGTLTIDSIAFFLFKLTAWPDLTSNFLMAPISIPSININDTANWAGFRFDLNVTDFELLTDDYVTISKDTINSRLVNQSIFRVIIGFDPPIQVPKNQNFGFLFFSGGANQYKDSVRMLGGREWRLSTKECYSTILRRNGIGDTVESTWRYIWNFNDPVYFRALHQQPIKQNFDFIILGYYDAPTDIKQVSNESSTLALHPVAPNPASSNTNFSFSIMKNSNVNLSIYNTMGQLVDEIVNTQMAPGTYDVQYDVSAIPTGTYFYVLKSGADSRSMILKVLR